MQVASGDEGSVVNVWDIHSGSRALHFTKCHGKHEITAMALDSAGRRLLTGSRRGDIKVGPRLSVTSSVRLLLESKSSGILTGVELHERAVPAAHADPPGHRGHGSDAPPGEEQVPQCRMEQEDSHLPR